MALAVTEEHAQLAGSVQAWAQRNSPVSVARAAADGNGTDSVYRDALRPGLAEQGVLGLHVPEPDGQGYGLAELCVAVSELGRAIVPGSFLPTVLTSAAMVAAGCTGKVVASLADGHGNGAIALAADLRAQPGPDGAITITGSADSVLGAPGADLVVLPVRRDADVIWVAVDAASLEINKIDALDLTRQLGQVTADGVVVPADRQLEGLTAETVANLAAVIIGAEAVGIADWAVQTAADYAKIRHQFGRPIGQFQAVKHRCARMLVAAEQAAAVVWDAARALDPGNAAAAGEADFAAAAAASLAADAAVSCVHECIQVLGGIGYTWEHDAHLYYRRAMTLRALLGSAVVGERSWKDRMARLAISGQSRRVQLKVEGGDELRASVRTELAEIGKVHGAERNTALGAGGWVMPHMPKPWGRGAGALEQLIIDEELRAAGIHVPGLAIGAWVVPALIQYGTPQQQERFLPATLRLDYLWCQLFSEPGAGSDLAGISTKAVRVDGGWKITGQKIWTSLAREASWAICIARTDPEQPRHDGISYFLVDMHAPGIEVRPLREIGGDAFFNQVFLDDVFVPDDCLVGEVNGGWKIARTTLANERVSLSRSWTFGCGVPELVQVASAASQPPLDQIGELVAAGHAIDLLALRAALKQLSGTEPGATGSVRKLLSMRHAQQVAELCWEMSGATGAVGGRHSKGVGPDGAPDGAYWARQILITRALTIGGGTTDIQHNIISERILGLPRDPEPPTAHA
ncbi:MAG TPA: acyl-CoA dehydrogenase [Streptosporangiaceae bacterium]|nr:acyl-CoA dehydrogenase [Streptosporangiaceae bacterium]